MTAEHQIEASDDWLEQSSEQSSEQWIGKLESWNEVPPNPAFRYLGERSNFNDPFNFFHLSSLP